MNKKQSKALATIKNKILIIVKSKINNKIKLVIYINIIRKKLKRKIIIYFFYKGF